MRSSALRITMLMMMVVSCARIAVSSPLVVRVDPTVRHQTMHGWGASGAWWVRWFADVPEATQEAALRLLFTDDGADGTTGIGLDIYRFNLPAAADDRVGIPTRRTPDVETAPFQYDLSRDADNIAVLRRVHELGVRRFVLFSNSPPARMTVSGSPVGGDDGLPNLRPGLEREFARYVVDLAERIIEEANLADSEVAISPVNEPQWEWGGKAGRRQEGCRYTPDQVTKVLRATVLEVRERGLDLRVEGPESGSWSASRPYAEAMFDDPVIADQIDAFALHSYWSNAEDKRSFAGWFSQAFPGKELRMTEYCHMVNGGDHGIQSGLHVARTIHEDLVIGNATEWTWWLALGSGSYHDKLLVVDRDKHELRRSGRMLALGHWSRFIPPGSVRIAAEVEADAGHADQQPVLVTAFHREDGRIALVLLNETETDTRVALRFGDNAPEIANSYLTDDTRSLAAVPAGSPVVPARGLLTLVTAPISVPKGK